MIRLHEVGPAAKLTVDQLRQALAACGVCYGLVEEGLEQMLSEGSATESTSSVLVAQGEVGVFGDKASTYIAFQRTPPGVAAGDTDAVTAVKEGELLAEVSIVGTSRAAVDVTGKQLPMPLRDGGEGLNAGHNVHVETRGNKTHFYAAVSGRARIVGGTLAVNLVSYVEEHVESSLRVDKGTDLHVRGSVRGAHIVAGGSITVDGVIEGGSTVQAQGDVIVGRGIIGSNTRVVAMRNVDVKLVRGSSVVAMGDITVEGHLVNARVRARGKLIVHGDAGEDGSAVGGELSAGHNIAAKRIRKLDEALGFCRTNTLRIFRTLGISEIDASNFKRIIENTTPEKRRPAMQRLRRLKGLVETRERSLQSKREPQQEQELVYSNASILVTEYISANVKVHIGPLSMVVASDRAATIFARNGDEIEARTP